MADSNETINTTEEPKENIAVVWFKKLSYVWVTAFAFVLIGVYAAIAMNFSFLNPVSQAVKDFSITDIYYQALAQNPDSNYSVTVVDMSHMYERSEVAELLYDVEACNPKVVAVDLVFQDKRTDLVGNDMLVDIARTYDNIVFSFFRQEVQNNDQEEVHSFFVDSIPVTQAFTDMPRGLYGKMKRKVPLAGEAQCGMTYSFCSEAVNRYVGDTIIPLKEDVLDINFTPTNFCIVPGDSVLYYQDQIEGRIVIVGGVNRKDDQHDSPLGKMAGPVLLAYSMQTILENKELVSLPAGWLAVISFVIVLITYIIKTKYSEHMAASKHGFVRNICGSLYVVGLVTSCWLAVVVMLSFIVFCEFNVNVNIGWALAAVTFLTNAKSLVNGIINMMDKK